MQKKNYQIMLENEILKAEKKEKKPTLLLHACCAPCSSYVLEYLARCFLITVYFYNPNITSREEYDFRLKELKRLVSEADFASDVSVMEGEYCPELFFAAAKGLEKENEGGSRCFNCYMMRLKKTAEKARELSFDCFSTTLSVSPYKNAEKLNEIGGILSDEYSVKYLYSDFKKKNGYKRSVELSQIYKLYRQDYCGCVYSKINREQVKLK